MTSGVRSIVCATCRVPYAFGHICGAEDPDEVRRCEIRAACDNLAEDGVPDEVLAPIRAFADSLVQADS